MPDNTYATFTERNDHEGETWRFYIPVEGNEAALSELKAIVNRAGQEYHLDLVPLPEQDVDARVAAPDDNGYMASHTKLTGRLVIPGIAVEASDWADDVFYKGSVRELMETSDGA